MTETTDNPHANKSWIRRLVLVVLFLCTLVLGTAGGLGKWPLCQNESQQSVVECREVGKWIDSSLKAAAYLTLNGFDISEKEEPGIWPTRLARISALLFVILAAGTALNAIFHWRASMKRWGISRQDHDLIIGLGWHGKELLKDRNGVGQTIAVDPAPDPIARALCASLGVPLIEGDARSKDTMKHMGLDKATRAFVSAGSDDLNIEIAHALAEAVKDARTPPLTLTVNLESPSAFQTMRSLLGRRKGIELHMFNSTVSTAQALYSSDEFRIDRFNDSAGKAAHVVLLGDGEMARELLRQTVQFGIFEDDASLNIDFLCPDGAGAARGWRREFPCYSLAEEELMTVCRPDDATWDREKVLTTIRFHELPASPRTRIDWCRRHIGSRGKVVTCIVAMREPAATCSVVESIGTTLLDIAGNGVSLELWVYYNNPSNALRGSLMASLRDKYRAIKPKGFFGYLGKFDRNLATGTATDSVAMRVNAMYAVKDIETMDLKDQQHKIAIAWNEATEDDRDSSRQSAVHAHIKKRIRDRFAGSDESKRALLAAIEHRRWCAEYLLKGYAPLTRNVAQAYLGDEERKRIDEWFGDRLAKKRYKGMRLHVDLIPYADLPVLLGLERGKKEQDKDHQITLLDWVLSGSHVTSGE